MEIGGFFPYEETSGTKTNYAIRMCPSATDMKHLMSNDVPFITVARLYTN